MPSSTVVKHYADGSITVKDGTGTPIDITVPFTQGDLSISDLSADQREVVTYTARGVRTAVRYTDPVYPSGSFTCQMSHFTSATDNAILDAVRKAGAFAAAVSTLGANEEVYTLDIVLTIEGSDFGDSGDHVATLTDCYCTASVAEGQPNVITINFICYGEVTFS